MTQRIVVGFDGLPAVPAAAGWAASQALLRGAELVAWVIRGRRDSRRPANAVGAKLPGARRNVVRLMCWGRLGTDLLTMTSRQLTQLGRDLAAALLGAAGVMGRPAGVHGLHLGCWCATTAAQTWMGRAHADRVAGRRLGSPSGRCVSHPQRPVMITHAVAEQHCEVGLLSCREVTR